jgi:hypothetical protein
MAVVGRAAAVVELLTAVAAVVVTLTDKIMTFPKGPSLFSEAGLCLSVFPRLSAMRVPRLCR